MSELERSLQQLAKENEKLAEEKEFINVSF